MIGKYLQHVRLCIRTGFAETIGVEFMFEEALDLRSERPRRLKLWSLEDLTRAPDGFTVIACLQ